MQKNCIFGYQYGLIESWGNIIFCSIFHKINFGINPLCWHRFRASNVKHVHFLSNFMKRKHSSRFSTIIVNFFPSFAMWYSNMERNDMDMNINIVEKSIFKDLHRAYCFVQQCYENKMFLQRAIFYKYICFVNTNKYFQHTTLL